MSIHSHEDQDPTLPPPGSRWGAGARSVLPYLTKSLQARPSAPEQPRESKPAADARLPERPSSPAA